MNIPIPESSVLYTVKIQMVKSIDEPEEEKSVSLMKKKMFKTQESKKTIQKPRVHKGAPINSNKNRYAKNIPAKIPKPLPQKIIIDEEIKAVANLPPFKISSVRDLEDEINIADDLSYEIITSEPPPVPELKFNTVQQFGICSDSSSDDLSYHSDDKELFNIKEVDDRLEHTNQDLKFKLQEIERSEREYERIIDQRRNELVNKIGVSCFQELYGYFKDKFNVRNK